MDVSRLRVYTKGSRFGLLIGSACTPVNMWYGNDTGRKSSSQYG